MQMGGYSMLYKIAFDTEGLPDYLILKKDQTYKFKEVSAKELFEIRLKPERGVVYKKNGRLFYALLDRNVNFYQNDEFHLCGKNCSNVCKGCPRTRDLTVPYQFRYIPNRKIAVERSWRIEKYDFITEAAESFNMTHDKDSCLVISCSNYQTKGRQPVVLSRTELERKKVSLAALHFEDFSGNTIEEFRAWRHSMFLKSFEIPSKNLDT